MPFSEDLTKKAQQVAGAAAEKAKAEAAASGLSGLLSGLFGGQQMNAPQAGGNMGRGGSGDFGGGFDPSSMGSKPERNYSGGGNP